MSEELNSVLQSFSRIEKVLGAVLMNREGGVLADSLEEDKDLRNREKEIFASLKLGEKLGKKLGLGTLNQSYLEYPRISFTAEKFRGGKSGGVNDEEKVLIVISQAGANLVRIRLEIRKVKKILEEILS